MKKILSTLIGVFLISTGTLFAQNPGIINPQINPDPYIEGGTGTASFQIQNTTIPISASVGLVINITFGNSLPAGPPSGAGAAYFNWSQPDGANTYKGVQIGAIPGQGGFPVPLPFREEITFNVNVTGHQGSFAGFNANLTNVAGLINNDGSDDNNGFLKPIALGSLPVEFLSFTGRKVGKVVELDWTTVTEQNNTGFEVQKSEDGQDWDVIGWVEGNGTVTRNIDYNFVDKFPFIGENYYRLQQFDYDGRFEYSNTIVVNNIGKEVAINILPNPSPGPFSVVIENPKKEKMRVTLFDSAGQLIYESELIEDETMWRKEFKLVQKEMYFISVQIGKEVKSKKILIIDRA